MTFILYYGRIKSIYEKNVIVRTVMMTKNYIIIKRRKREISNVRQFGQQFREQQDTSDIRT